MATIPPCFVIRRLHTLCMRAPPASHGGCLAIYLNNLFLDRA
ncbi:MAG: hypothetical protein UW70_C0041G0009 [Candidatus Peregrinibacteria bacterium GW2011_GWA2_44_7]|nr:MAG: hypothetical protein UW70_C0041G0009 [Candidatus Peregrinibacteria bacterium GW2011_GWA2_44_7]